MRDEWNFLIHEGRVERLFVCPNGDNGDGGNHLLTFLLQLQSYSTVTSTGAPIGLPWPLSIPQIFDWEGVHEEI